MVMKLLRWSIVLAVVGWLGSNAVSAATRYFELNDVLERVVVETRPAEGILDANKATYLRQVHAHVIARASRPDAPLADDGVVITASTHVLKVTVSWTQPMLTYKGQAMWAVPLSLTRTFSNTL